MGIIYRIFNIKTNKSYIGKTKYDLYYRLNQHIKDYKRFPNRPLYNDFINVGIDHFSAEILGHFEEKDLDIKEMEFITLYDSFNTGYNGTKGGEGGSTLNLPELEIIEYYKSSNLKHTANYFNIDIKTCRNILLNNNIKIKNNIEVSKVRSNKVRIEELDMNFNTVQDCALFLIKNSISLNKDVKTVGNNIKRVCNKQINSYLKYHFNYVL